MRKFKYFLSCSLAALLFSGCAILGPLQNPTTADVLKLASGSMRMIQAQRLVTCVKGSEPHSAERAKCADQVEREAKIAKVTMEVAKRWLPELEYAIRNGDEIRDRTAREHLAEALSKLPDAYASVVKMVRDLKKIRD